MQALNKISLKYVHYGPIDNIVALIKKNQCSYVELLHICVTRPQWVNRTDLSHYWLLQAKSEIFADRVNHKSVSNQTTSRWFCRNMSVVVDCCESGYDFISNNSPLSVYVSHLSLQSKRNSPLTYWRDCIIYKFQYNIINMLGLYTHLFQHIK